MAAARSRFAAGLVLRPVNRSVRCVASRVCRLSLAWRSSAALSSSGQHPAPCRCPPSTRALLQGGCGVWAGGCRRCRGQQRRMLQQLPRSRARDVSRDLLVCRRRLSLGPPASCTCWMPNGYVKLDLVPIIHNGRAGWIVCCCDTCGVVFEANVTNPSQCAPRVTRVCRRACPTPV